MTGSEETALVPLWDVMVVPGLLIGHRLTRFILCVDYHTTSADLRRERPACNGAPESASDCRPGPTPAPPARRAQPPQWSAPRRSRAPAAARRLAGATLFLQRITSRTRASTVGSAAQGYYQVNNVLLSRTTTVQIARQYLHCLAIRACSNRRAKSRPDPLLPEACDEKLAQQPIG